MSQQLAIIVERGLVQTDDLGFNGGFKFRDWRRIYLDCSQNRSRIRPSTETGQRCRPVQGSSQHVEKYISAISFLAKAKYHIRMRDPLRDLGMT